MPTICLWLGAGVLPAEGSDIELLLSKNCYDEGLRTGGARAGKAAVSILAVGCIDAAR